MTSNDSSSRNNNVPAGDATTDYILFPPSVSGTAAMENDPHLVEVQALSPVPFREEAGLHNDNSERIYFDEELTFTSTPAGARNDGHDDDDVDVDDIVDEYLESPLLVRQSSRLRGRAPLNGLNFLNVVTYAAHLFVSWGIGIWGLNGILETRWEIITKYETLVTPAHWAYYLWVPILVLEGIFTIAQLFPHYRSRPVIQDGTGFFFFYTFLIQTAWTLFFSFQLFIFSFISVVAALISLLYLLASQHKALLHVRRQSKLEYVLFRFPFYLHTGWMTLMAVDHLSILLRLCAPNHVGMQVAVDILSLALLLPVATTALSLRTTGPFWPQQDFVIPFVVIWSYCGIGTRLSFPSDVMLEVYGRVVVEAVRFAAFFLAGTTACALIPCIVVWMAREFCVIGLVELDE